MPANYDRKRRIGSIVRIGGAIKPLNQDRDYFQWKIPAADVSAANPGTAAVVRTLTVPAGINVIADIVVGFATAALSSNPAGIMVSDLACDDVTPNVSTARVLNNAVAGTAANYYTNVRCRTNTSRQVRSRIQISDANISLNILTFGYWDSRGKDGGL